MAAKVEGWYFDGTPLEEHGRVIETREGWDDTPGVRGENTVLLGRHGEAWRRKRYQAGRKTLTIGIHGTLADWSIPETGTAQRARYERNLDGLLSLIAPRHRLIEVQRVYADSQRRTTAGCEVINAITPAVTGNSYGQVQFELVNPGAFWRDIDQRVYDVGYVVGGASSQSLEVYSLAGQTAPCTDAVVTVHGPCTTVTVRDAATGSGFTYGALGSSASLVVDAGAFSAKVGATSVLTALTLYDGQLLEVAPAPTPERGPSLTVAATGASAGFKVSTQTRRAWLR